MKKIITSKIKIAILIIFLLAGLFYSVKAVDEENFTEDKENLKIKTEYEYNEKDNTVTGKIISNNKLKNTKKAWNLSEDGLIYTNENLKSNGSYYTTVEDIYGNKEKVLISVELVDDKGPKVTVEYKYNEETNKVTAIIHSDEEMANTKNSKVWFLSEDGLTYTNSNMESNGSYYTTVEDKWRNKTKVLIDVKLVDDKAPKISMEYNYNKNDTITVIMHANEELLDSKPTWTLSEDKLSFSKEYKDNQNYWTLVKDKWGNETWVEINFEKWIDNNQPNNLSVGYMYIKQTKVIVQILSDTKMKETKPTWELKSDGYRYTKNFTYDIDYTTLVQLENGNQATVSIRVDKFLKIIYETGTYGASGAALNGVSGGSNLEYYRWGSGSNVMFATFCIHGFEDNWDRDGSYLIEVAENFYQELVSSNDESLAKKWTIYILKEVNPDGRRLGTSSSGPGRRTVYSKIGKGIDINRAWQTEGYWISYKDSKNYNGTGQDQAYEAEYLKNFLLTHKTSNGQNVLVDLHGWENQLIGNEEICNYYKEQYQGCSTRNYGKYGTQYLIGWARQNIGAKTALIELPSACNRQNAVDQGLTLRYIWATMKMLRQI